MTHYPCDGRNAVQPRPLVVGERLKFNGDRRWWTVKAVTEHFTALTRQAAFHSKDTCCYTVIDWRNGIRGACNLIGQAWGDGSYTEKACAEMLDAFEHGTAVSGPLEISHRNWVPLQFEGEPSASKGGTDG